MCRFSTGIQVEVLAAGPRSSVPCREQFVLWFPRRYLGLALSLQPLAALTLHLPLPAGAKPQGFALGWFHFKASVLLT